jgi:hypothetical protein
MTYSFIVIMYCTRVSTRVKWEHNENFKKIYLYNFVSKLQCKISLLSSAIIIVIIPTLSFNEMKFTNFFFIH